MSIVDKKMTLAKSTSGHTRDESVKEDELPETPKIKLELMEANEESQSMLSSDSDEEVVQRITSCKLPSNSSLTTHSAQFQSGKNLPMRGPSKTTHKDNHEDEYEELALIGEGAFGEVSHVIKRSDAKQYARKKISKKSCENIK